MKRKITNFLLWLLERAGIGIIPENPIKKLCIRIIILFVLITSLFTMLLFVLKISSKMQDIALMVCYMLSVLIGISGYLSIHLKTETIRELLHTLDNNVFTYTDEAELQPKYIWILEEENMIFVGKILGCYTILNGGLACVMAALFFVLSDQELMIVYPGVLPWNTNATNFSFQVVLSLTSVSIYYIRWISCLIFNFEFERQFERLCYALNTMNKRSGIVEEVCNEKVNKPRDPYFQMENFRMKLTECIHHHQKLRAYV